MTDPDSLPSSGLRWHHLWLLVPFLWQVGGVPWANGVAWRPFGLPFLMAWEMAGVVAASLTIAFVHRLSGIHEATGR